MWYYKRLYCATQLVLAEDEGAVDKVSEITEQLTVVLDYQIVPVKRRVCVQGSIGLG